MQNGFELSKETSSKAYAIYLKCHCSGKPRPNPNLQGKRAKKSKKTGKQLTSFFKNSIGCKFQIYFYFDEEKKSFRFNQKSSFNSRNHDLVSTLAYKLREEQIKQFTKESVGKKNIKPSDLVEKVKLKFEIDMSYQHSANLLYKVKEDVFGDPADDAENLKTLCEDISKAFPSFYFNYQQKEDSKLSSLFFATGGMRDQYIHYNNLLILDTTFATNRFKMPLMVGGLVNNMGRTVLCFFALVSDETTLSFQFVFDCFLECFGTPPKNIITDECKSFNSAIKIKFPGSTHFICSWHKMNNIIKQMSHKGCYRNIKSKSLFNFLIIF